MVMENCQVIQKVTTRLETLQAQVTNSTKWSPISYPTHKFSLTNSAHSNDGWSWVDQRLWYQTEISAKRVDYSSNCILPESIHRRLGQHEARICAVASSFNSFWEAYVQRLEQEKRLQHLKVRCSIIIGYVAGGVCIRADTKLSRNLRRSVRGWGCREVPG
ncbi:hypothetical protein PC120_g15106 [Phytophthora cactorum]|nr:hypothetical protein PC120_g15106 [Phytophthora cactorum]